MLKGMTIFDAKTLLCASVANPNRESPSPYMHNVGYRHLDINMVYVAVEPEPEELPAAISGIRALGFRGCSVSKPFKQRVLDLVDQVDEAAGEIGAINSILNDHGRLIGFNTDWIGVCDSIEEQTPLSGKRVVLLGAGGAARAIAWGLRKRGAAAVVFNRSLQRAQKLCDDLDVELGGTFEDLDPQMPYEIVVNAVPLGGHGFEGQMAVPKGFLRRGVVVLDEIMKPKKTALLQEAERVGAVGIPGIRPLLLQGAPQFERFTGRKAPLEVMYRALEELLPD